MRTLLTLTSENHQSQRQGQIGICILDIPILLVLILLVSRKMLKGEKLQMLAKHLTLALSHGNRFWFSFGCRVTWLTLLDLVNDRLLAVLHEMF